MSRINLILVAEPGRRRDLYLEALENYDVHIYPMHQPDEVFEKSGRTKYAGMLLDFSTMMRSHGFKKQQLEEMGNKFPMIRLHINPTNNQIVGLMFGQKIEGDDLLKGFIRKCKAFKPCRIRISKRFDKILNVILFTKASSNKKGLKANTMNISEEGGFITTIQPFNKKERFDLRIKELTDKALISCEVRWTQPWGTKDRLPGIGFSFLNISPKQKIQLDRLLH